MGAEAFDHSLGGESLILPSYGPHSLPLSTGNLADGGHVDLGGEVNPMGSRVVQTMHSLLMGCIAKLEESQRREELDSVSVQVNEGF